MYGSRPIVRHLHRLWLYLLVGLVLLFLILPSVIIVPMSFSDSRYLTFPPEAWSLRWYRVIQEKGIWREAAWVSLRVAFLSCLLATVSGVAAAYALHVSEWRFVARLKVVFLLPLIVPHIILAIGIYYLFARIGLNSTITGLVVANTMLTAPFVIVTTLAGLRSYNMDEELVARSLGWNRFQAFMRVTLPQIRGSILAGALFAFVVTLDEVIIAMFVSGGHVQTLTKVMFVSLRDEIDPAIAAVSSIFIVVTVTLGALGAALSRDRR